MDKTLYKIIEGQPLKIIKTCDLKTFLAEIIFDDGKGTVIFEKGAEKIAILEFRDGSSLKGRSALNALARIPVARVYLYQLRGYDLKFIVAYYGHDAVIEKPKKKRSFLSRLFGRKNEHDEEEDGEESLDIGLVVTQLVGDTIVTPPPKISTVFNIPQFITDECKEETLKTENLSAFLHNLSRFTGVIKAEDPPTFKATIYMHDGKIIGAVANVGVEKYTGVSALYYLNRGCTVRKMATSEPPEVPEEYKVVEDDKLIEELQRELLRQSLRRGDLA